MRKFIAVALFLILPCWVSGQSYKTETGHVEFKSTVPLHSFTGESDHLVGMINLADSTVDFYVDLHTIETGIKKRDKDMLRTLEAKKFPFAEFFGKLISGFDPQIKQPQKVTVRGEFKVHDVARKETIEGTLQKNGDTLIAKATWKINMEKHDIRPPGILFYRVSEIITITINATLKKIDQ